MKALVILTLLVSTAHADALDVAAVAPDDNILTVTAGGEHGMIVGAGFAHAASVADHLVILDADATLSAAGFDLADFRLRAGALTPVVDGARWKVLAGAAAIVRGTHDDIARMVDVGVDAALYAGRYTPRWFAAGEVGLDAALATHIAPTDAYRMVVYADARDGWYRDTGGLVRIGAQGGVTFGRSEVALRAGVLRDVTGNPPLFPIYATLTYAVRW
jgi:hypothetical protein